MDEATKAPTKRPAPVGEKAVRIPVELLERAAKLLPKLQATAWGDALRWNDTALVRLALSRGLAALEEELSALERKLADAAPAPKRKAKP